MTIARLGLLVLIGLLSWVVLAAIVIEVAG